MLTYTNLFSLLSVWTFFSSYFLEQRLLLNH